MKNRIKYIILIFIILGINAAPGWGREQGEVNRFLAKVTFLSRNRGWFWYRGNGRVVPHRVPFNVILITVDTLRADYVTLYGGRKGVTRYIDRLADSGIVFTRAFAHVPMTLPSHTSILTGLPPSYHGVHDNLGFRVPDQILTLAEWLRGQGYRTAAFISGFPLDRRFGLDQGFDTYQEGYTTGTPYGEKLERPAQQTLNAVLDWLRRRPRRPWFLWVHLFDPHLPYAPPEPFRSRYRANPYAGEVAYVDTQLQRLIDYLDQTGLLASVVIIFTSDHGEALGEHGERSHGYFAYNATLHVPLILYLPWLNQRIRVDRYVSHQDLFPTLADLLGRPIPAGLPGRSLVPLWRATRSVPRNDPAIYFESRSMTYAFGWAPIVGIIWREHKFIDTPIPELYDLRSDFSEQHNLAPKRELKFFRMKLARMVPGLSREASGPTDQETLERLRSLGYVGSTRPIQTPHEFTEADDPKRRLGLYLQYRNALRWFKNGEPKRAIQAMKDLITNHRDLIVAYLDLSSMYRTLGDMRNALNALHAALRVAPRHLRALRAYGLLLVEAGRWDQAIATLTTVIRWDPGDPEVWNQLGVAYTRKQQYDRALSAFRKALELDPEYAAGYSNLGILYLNQKQYERARTEFLKALRVDASMVQAYNGLAVCALSQGRSQEAVRLWRQALRYNPDYPPALFNLGQLLWQQGKTREGARLLERYLQIAGRNLPPDEYFRIRRMIDRARSGP